MVPKFYFCTVHGSPVDNQLLPVVKLATAYFGWLL
jgi:altronate dehydratase